MAQIRRISCKMGFTLGFDHSYQSVSFKQGTVLDLEKGDDEEKVRSAETKRLKKLVVDACVKFKKKHDKPKKGQ